MKRMILTIGLCSIERKAKILRTEKMPKNRCCILLYVSLDIHVHIYRDRIPQAWTKWTVRMRCL